MKFLPGRLGIVVAATAAFLLTAVLPAAATGFVQDQAGMFSAGTVAQLNERIANFNAATGKAIVVITTQSLGGASLQSAAQSAFSQQGINGVLIFIARDDRRDIILPDRAGAQAGWFAPSVLREIRTAMEDQFRNENYDAGITGAVGALLGIYRAHAGGIRQPGSGLASAPYQGPVSSSRGGHVPMFWWVIIVVAGFLVLRSIMRAAAASRYYGGPGAPPGASPPGGAPGAGYGPGPGYGYGGFGGGGSFWSGLLGGLGGAWLGNELFRGGSGAIAPTEAGQIAPDAGGGWGGTDSGGWQSDAGQPDGGAASSGDWSGGGFGDSGGGDFGGGGGDSGGGW
jgi:uncharacterized membrane protein YgcG